MGTVVAQASMSLDGYIAKADNSIGRLFDWYEAGDVELTTWASGELDRCLRIYGVQADSTASVLHSVPTYEYKCPNGHVFELFKRIADPQPDKCPVCGASPVETVLYPVPVRFPRLRVLLDRLRPRQPQEGAGEGVLRVELGQQGRQERLVRQEELLDQKKAAEG